MINLPATFPNLKNSVWRITSPATISYNCIAWACGDNQKWWWPDSYGTYYWPHGINREESLDAFIELFEYLGFSKCDNADFEDGIEKIAIYIDANGKPTHAARQGRNGIWLSKLGQQEDIEHETYSLCGNAYGQIAIFMKRRIKQ